MEIPKTVVFQGVKYNLMGGKRKYYLSYTTNPKDRKGAKGLHVATWEFYNGKNVPQGYEVHHKDGDTLNNSIDNLECISYKEHKKAHAKATEERNKSEKQLVHLEKIREKASEWHKSEEGKKWHTENIKKINERVPLKEKICSFCGKKFLAKKPYAKYCSNVCGYKERVESGYYNIKVKCIVCGKEFDTVKPINPSRIAKTCSRKCRGKLNWLKRNPTQNHS